MPIKPMRLIDYLNMFSWSQADLAREAGVSTHCVSRAINGKRIARRNAQKIFDALTRQFQAQGGNAHISIGSVQGLQIADVQRKKRKPNLSLPEGHGDLGMP
jgi:hypothetical protein